MQCGIAPLALRDGDREKLVSLTRSSTVTAGAAQQARIVLLAAEGVSNTEIAARTGVSRPTVIGWRARYEDSGMAGLVDRPRSGRPRPPRKSSRKPTVNQLQTRFASRATPGPRNLQSTRRDEAGPLCAHALSGWQ